ncbi:hypothetical protein ISF_03253 [Cordyceps fumosorosea ARSEF 2679]|uniref:Glycosyltransferase family 31 protein n=1 Tax=Cordyceps fumosorosea (strain ARSEF 2679) TaxID=1081104 RepID=A0A168AKN3_CORFA|nr:hypothetical protein ISF_03253 [Cordyceps fumosorosea ARSEF 2679]OAA68878.1 hypothetical protein ISF_03253 [Cordyceps fumosorosea ARSEF 2679]
MGQLAASGFSLPRRLVSTLFISALLAYTLILVQTCAFDIELSKIFASQHERASHELSHETDSYLDELLRKHDLSPRVEWAAWNILSTQRQERWASVTRVPRHFQPRQLRLFDPRGQERRSSTQMPFGTLVLPSPRSWRPGHFDASGFLFGVSTTYERLMADDRAVLKNWQWWLTDGQQAGSGAHLVVMLDRADDGQMEEVEGALAELAIPAMVYNAQEELSAATRYAQLAGELQAYGSALSAVGVDKLWHVLIDDTVFFPSLSYLDETLGAYNARDKVYIGVPSEREDWQMRDGVLSTDGGGVIILSRRALGHYISLSCAEPDAAPGEKSRGKSRAKRHWASTLRECLTGRGELSMHVVPGLFSPVAEAGLPLPSSRAEDLESGVRPLALRNRGPGLDVDTATAYVVADGCGEACFAQRFLFRDGWVLVNGVSISQYEYPPMLQRGSSGLAEDLSPPRVRPALAAQLHLEEAAGGAGLRLTTGGARHVWRLLDSSVDDYGAVWQAYVKRDVREKRAVPADEQAADDEPLDSVIILVWNGAKRT